MGERKKGTTWMIEGVVLIGVGRNLNRIIRACHSFGVQDIYCLNCEIGVKGNLFSATESVKLHEISSLDEMDIDTMLALEVSPSLPNIKDVSAFGICYIAIGGESTTLRKRDFKNMARISTKNKLCLTAEAALAIALYHFC